MAAYNNASASNFKAFADAAAFDVTSLTVAMWLRQRTLSASAFSFASRALTALDNGAWRMRNQGTNTVRFSVRTSDGVNNAATTTTISVANTWQHLVGRCDIPSLLIKIFNNGTEEGSTAIAGGATITALARDIRLFQNVSGAEACDADIAEFAMWDAVLTQAEITSLAAGVDPEMIRPTGRILCDQIFLGSKDRVRSLGTETGTLVAAAHPIQVRRNKRVIVSKPAAVTAVNRSRFFFAA